MQNEIDSSWETAWKAARSNVLISLSSLGITFKHLHAGLPNGIRGELINIKGVQQMPRYLECNSTECPENFGLDPTKPHHVHIVHFDGTQCLCPDDDDDLNDHCEYERNLIK